MSNPGDAFTPGGAPALAAAAAVVLALSLDLSGGHLDLLALALVSAAGLAALAASIFAARPSTGVGGRDLATGILALGLAASVVLGLARTPGLYADPAALGTYWPVLAVAGLVLASYLWRDAPRWLARARFPAVAFLAALLGAAVILASPSPSIDVWRIQQEGARALLDGRNPYVLRYANLYGPGTPFLDPSLLSPDGLEILAFPYLPLVLLLDVPGLLLGDVRWALLAAVVLSSFLVRALGKGSVRSELAASFLLLQPRGWMVLELAWTEPFALAGILALALTAARARAASGSGERSPGTGWLGPGLAAAFALSTKQYVALLAVPFLPLVPARARLRAVGVALAGALLVALPFLVASPAAFFRGVVEFQLRQPFRTDALSWPAAIVARGGPRLPTWPAFALAGAVVLWALRPPASTGRALVAGASAWIVFVAFNKQAFANYYWLGAGLLCAGAAALVSPLPPIDPRAGARPG